MGTLIKGGTLIRKVQTDLINGRSLFGSFCLFFAFVSEVFFSLALNHIPSVNLFINLNFIHSCKISFFFFYGLQVFVKYTMRPSY